MKMITVQEASERWDVSQQRINVWLLSGRIRGAVRFGRAWAIPDKAQRPKSIGAPRGGPDR